MAILRQPFDPSSIPQPVILQQRLRNRTNMNNPQFYQQQQQAPPSFILGESSRQQLPVNSAQQQVQAPTSQEFIQAQLQKYAQRPAVPQLEPAARIQSPDSELVQPSNFQSFYNRLSAIRSIGDEQLNAAQARSAFQRMQAMQQPISAGGGGSSTKSSTKGGGGFGSAGSGVLGSVPSNPRANFQFAQNIAGNYGWNSPGELGAWYQLGMKESGWNNNAQNPTSTAYGIGQFLNSTWGGYGIPKTSNPALQVEAMARYIKARYGSPSRALAFHNAHNWY